jgi:hypothetical protein
VSLNLLMTSSPKPFLSSHEFSSGSTLAAARSSTISLRTFEKNVLVKIEKKGKKSWSRSQVSHSHKLELAPGEGSS